MTNMTLIACCSTKGGNPYTPAAGTDLNAFWIKFQECLQDYPSLTEPNDPAQWNAAICNHIQSVIKPCIGADKSFSIDKDCTYSRQTPTGWEPAQGVAHCLVWEGSDVVCCFGCERMAGVMVSPMQQMILRRSIAK